MLKFKLEEAGATTGGGGAAQGAAQGSAPSIVDPPSTGGAAGGAGATEPGAGDSAGKSWLEGLGDMGKDPSLQMFKSPSDLAKSWVSAQKLIGADKVVIPGAKATEEEWAAFYNKIGRPDVADKYEVKDQTGKDLLDKNFKEIAHKNGLTMNQVKALVEWDSKRMGDLQSGHQAKQDATLRDELAAFEQKLGGADKFKATVDKARTAVRALADDGFKDFLRQSGIGNRPEAIAFFAKLADMMGEDKIRDGTGIPFKGEDPHQIQTEIEALEKEMYKDLNSPNMASWVERRNRLYERMTSLRQPN